MKPSAQGIVTAASMKMRAEIITGDNGSLSGKLYSNYLDAPYVFLSLVQMIVKMEEIFDANRYPEKFMLPRTFGVAKRGKKVSQEEGIDTVKDSESHVKKDADGSKCTFEISVRFRQNATWQGEILWADKNLRQNFRSVLEMLRLMDEALSDGKDEVVSWDNEGK